MDLAQHQDYNDADLDEGLIPLLPLPPVHGKSSTTRPAPDATAASPFDERTAPDESADPGPTPAPSEATA